jgi:hypothetical protein
MQHVSKELESLINQHYKTIEQIPEDEMRHKPAPGKWSKKEILGHMIDSAESNIRRFVIGQYEDTPSIGYNQDKWVAICNYQEWDKMELMRLWWCVNKQICRVLDNMPEEMKGRNVQTEKIHTIEWLAEDYLKHLKHHLHQVLDLEPVAYP